MTIHYILTGGTIDSYYDGSKDTAVPNLSSVIPSFIQNLKLYSDTEFTQVCMEDSRDLSQNDLDQILKTIDANPHHHFIIHVVRGP